MTWILWAALLVVQNASFTWVSRARNSGALGYHAIAAVFSNGVYFLSLVFSVGLINQALESGEWARILPVALFYTVCTVTGSIGAHHLLMTKVETGKRKVGGS